MGTFEITSDEHAEFVRDRTMVEIIGRIVRNIDFTPDEKVKYIKFLLYLDGVELL